MNDSLKAQCIAEFLGTGLFMFFGIGCLCAMKVAGVTLGWWEICIIWGLGISLAVYLTAGVSGAHLNPVVTIALWLFACFPVRKVVPYIIAQIAGACGGAAMVYLLYHNVFVEYETVHNLVRGSAESLQLAGLFTTYAAPALSIWQAALVEIVITSIFMCMIMALTDDGNGVPRGPLAPLLIGILVAVIGASLGPLTGFAMNPARDFGPKIFLFLAGWGKIAFTGGREIPYFVVPMFATVIGGCAGAACYRYLIGKNLPCNACKLEESEN